MKLILIPIMILSLNAFAAESPEFICATIKGRALYSKLKEMPLRDKTKHCTLSCHLTLKCSAIESWNMGLLKEIIDVFGPGNAEWDDLKADVAGIHLAEDKRATTTPECLRECKLLFEP
ncbi:MAG: hypothetical protein K2P81_05630 [Bacteriovoracaceae bacterium]|nr:hypothetical protein [Bacteriovoracaceae bacterium]